jgi:hypothetical protein
VLLFVTVAPASIVTSSTVRADVTERADPLRTVMLCVFASVGYVVALTHAVPLYRSHDAELFHEAVKGVFER